MSLGFKSCSPAHDAHLKQLTPRRYSENIHPTASLPLAEASPSSSTQTLLSTNNGSAAFLTSRLSPGPRFSLSDSYSSNRIGRTRSGRYNHNTRAILLTNFNSGHTTSHTTTHRTFPVPILPTSHRPPLIHIKSETTTTTPTSLPTNAHSIQTRYTINFNHSFRDPD